MDNFLKRFTLTMENYNYLKSLTLIESQELQETITETYNVIEEITFQNYIERIRNTDSKIVDGIYVGGIETAIWDDPYRISVFIPEYPPLLMPDNLNELKNSNVKIQWENFIAFAVNEFYKKKVRRFVDRVIIVFKFHFNKPGMRVDEYELGFIKNIFKYAKIYVEEWPCIYCEGTLDEVRKGTEITIIHARDFASFATIK